MFASLGNFLVAIFEIPVLLGIMALDYGVSVVGGAVFLVAISITFIYLAKLTKSIRYVFNIDSFSKS